MKNCRAMLLALSCIAGFAVPATVAGSTYYVSTLGSDENAGTGWEAPFATLGTAVSAASAGDEIVVSNGTYSVGGYHIAIDKRLTIRGIATAKDTMISGGNIHRCFAVSAGGDVLFEDLTIADGFATDENHFGGGIRASGDSSDAMAKAVCNRCIFTRNQCRDRGAAAWAGPYSDIELVNCLVVGNHSQNYGVLSAEGTGGSMTIRSCTVTRNTENSAGGGIILNFGSGISTVNSIVCDNYGSTGESNYAAWTSNLSFDHCCIRPVPNGSTDCTDASPDFLVPGTGLGIAYAGDGDFQLGPASACLDAASASAAPSADFDGTARPIDGDGDGTALPDIGCFEAPGPNDGALRCVAYAGVTGGIFPLPVEFTSAVAGEDHFGVTYSWDFGDGETQSGTGLDSVPHVYQSAGNYTATLTVSNASGERQTSSPVSIAVSSPVLYVSPEGGDVFPYDSWENAATSIQTAIDAAYGTASTSSVVRVTNGTYQLSGMLMIGKPIVIESVEGWRETVIVGGNNQRCAYIYADGVTLSGFTFTNGVATGGTGGNFGGNINCQAKDCVVRDSRITRGYVTDRGGGVSVHNGGSLLLENCLVDNNYATNYGGAMTAEGNTLACVNCTIVNNFGPNFQGRGAFGEGPISLRNCIVWGNWSNYANPDNYCSQETLSYCCTTPLAPGDGNIADAPNFVQPGTGFWDDYTGGDYSLRDGSPCIDAGTSTDAPDADIDGVERPLDGDGNGVAMHDIGCFEALDASSMPLVFSVTQSPVAGLAPLPVEFSVSMVAGKNTNGLSISWNFGDGTPATDFSSTLETSHTYAKAGTYQCVASLRNSDAYIATYEIPAFSVSPSTIYVSAGAASSAFPYDTPETAAPDLATAFSAAYGDATAHSTILVAPGTYKPSSTISPPVPLDIIGDGTAEEVVFDGANQKFRGMYIGSAASGSTVANITIANFNDACDRAVGYGGGIQVNGATDVTIRGCRIIGNSADDRGGAIGVVGNGALLLQDSLVAGNQSSNGAGAITLEGGSIVVEGCTITRNFAQTDNFMNGIGPGINAFNGSSVVIRNSIVHGNGLTSGVEMQCHIENWNNSSIDSSCVYPFPDVGENNITNVPQFVSYGMGDGVTLAGFDFRLAPTSPCRNAGDNSFVRTLTDLDGNPRKVGVAVEMGCYELQPTGTVLMVK